MKDKKIFKYILIILSIILVIALVRQLLKENIGININELTSTLQKTGTKLLKAESGKEKEYRIDIYLKFGQEPSEDENSNKKYFEHLMTLINPILKKKSFRLIDKDKDMIIRGKFNANGIIKYIVNNDINYFENIASLENIGNLPKESDLINPVIKSQELIDLLNDDWNRNTSKTIGKITRSVKNVDYYDNNGYRIKMIDGKVAAIIFNKSYNNEVFEGIYPGMPENDFKYRTLNTSSNDITIQGFDTEKYTVFYYNKEVFVTRKKAYDEAKNLQFEKVVNELLKNKDYNEFYKKVIEIYPDFYIKRIKSDSIYISFPLEGFEIKYNYQSPTVGEKETGIYIYSNYKGKVYLNKTLQDIVKENKIKTDQIKLTPVNSNEVLIYDMQEI